MNEIDSALEQLIATILDSEVYREYDALRNRVNQNPELKNRIDEFRKRIFILQNRNENTFDTFDAFETFDQYDREYSDLMENSLSADFLAAELTFCRMMQEINLRLVDAIHFE